MDYINIATMEEAVNIIYETIFACRMIRRQNEHKKRKATA